MAHSEWLVRGIALPAEAGIWQLFPCADLADSYAIRLPANASDDPERLARFMFGRQAPWATALMRLRDVLVARFGVKTAAQLRTASQSANGERIGIFKIYSCGSNEIILGEDDRHLDFRISVLRQLRPVANIAAPYLLVSSVVHCHNRFGKIYLKLITPFHRLIVMSILRRAARAGWPHMSGDQTNAASAGLPTA